MALIHSTSVLPSNADLPPCILIHGAANSAGVWIYWQEALAEQGVPAFALDLRGHGRSVPYDLSATSMQDYVRDVCVLAAQLSRPPILLGWSMGGLVAMMAATQIPTLACIGLAPSTPAVQLDPAIALRTREFTSADYGITSMRPEEQTVMPDLTTEERVVALASLGKESLRARDERKRGIVLKSVPCPLLIATGTQDKFWPQEAYADVTLAADYLSVEGASHWGLVLSRQTLGVLVPQVIAWVKKRAL